MTQANGGFYKPGSDKAFIQHNLNDGQGVGEMVLIRMVSGRTAGNPGAGVQPTLVYKTKKVKAVIVRLTPEEVTASGGIYQFGDLSVELLIDLKFADERTGEIGDRMVYQKTSYRVVGRTQNQTVEGRNVTFNYIMRKVGNE